MGGPKLDTLGARHVADITKCNDAKCSKSSNCWRFLAPSDFYQSFYSHSPRDGKVCDRYWPIRGKATESEQKKHYAKHGE